MTGPASPQSGQSGPVVYAEDHCALRWPLLALGAGLPAAAVILALAGLTAHLIALAAIAAPVLGAGLFGLLLLWQAWPTGIRVYPDRIAIGGVHRAERRAHSAAGPAGRPPQVASQQRQVFSCPWTSVQGLTQLTSPAELRDLRRQVRRNARRSASRQVPLGFLQAPFMRSALLIRRVPGAGRDQQFRHSYGAVGQQVHGASSPTWLVPTRHPEQLRAALEQLPAAPAVTGSLRDSPVAFS